MMPDGRISCKPVGRLATFKLVQTLQPVALTRIPLSRTSLQNDLLSHFFTEAEKISIEILNVEVLATPRSRFEGSDDIRSF